MIIHIRIDGIKNVSSPYEIKDFAEINDLNVFNKTIIDIRYLIQKQDSYGFLFEVPKLSFYIGQIYNAEAIGLRAGNELSTQPGEDNDQEIEVGLLLSTNSKKYSKSLADDYISPVKCCWIKANTEDVIVFKINLSQDLEIHKLQQDGLQEKLFELKAKNFQMAAHKKSNITIENYINELLEQADKSSQHEKFCLIT